MEEPLVKNCKKGIANAKKGIILFFALHLNSLIFANNQLNKVEFYNFEQYSSQEYNLNSFVNSIYQDSKGFIWFSTENGLTRYDGYDFKRIYYSFPTRDQSESNEIYSIMEINTDHYMLCTKDGIVYFDSKNDLFTIIEPITSSKLLVNFNGFKQMIRINEKYILIHSTNQLFIYNIETKKMKLCNISGLSNKENMPDLIKLFKDSIGKIWLGTGDQRGLFQVKIDFKNYLIEMTKMNILGDRIIFDIDEDLNGNLLFCTDKGIFLREKKTQKVNKLEGDNSGINFQMVDSENILWTGSRKSGMKYANLNLQEILKPFNNYSALINDFVSFIFEDREGTIWASTGMSGVVKFNKLNSKISTFFSRNVNYFNVRHLVDIVKDKNDVYWVASLTDGIYKITENTGKTIHYSIPDDIKCYYIYNLLLNDKNELYVGTYGNGIYFFNDQTNSFDNIFKIFGSEQGSQYIHSMAFTEEGQILAGTKTGLFSVEPHTGKSIRLLSQFLNEKINVIVQCEENKDCFYLGTENSGLFLYNVKENNLIPMFDEAKQKLDKKLTMITDIQVSLSDKNILFIATSSGGLIKYNIEKNTSVFLLSNEEISYGHIKSFVQENSENIWLCTDQGIFNYNIEKDKLYQYYEINKLTENMINFKIVKLNNKIVFNNKDKLLSFEPNQLYKNTISPVCSITEVEIAGESGELESKGIQDNKIEIQFNNTLKLSFSSFSFVNKNFNEFKYRLVPIHKNWINIGNNNSLIFSNLEPGSYTLDIKGSNNDGVFCNSPYSIPIIVIPPYYKSWWFKLVLVLLFAAVIYKIFIFRINMAEKRIQEKSDFEMFIRINEISPREKEIIDHLMDGKTREEIGEALFISPHTVKNHVYRIYRKLNVKNRGELMLKIKEKYNNRNDQNKE